MKNDKEKWIHKLNKKYLYIDSSKIKRELNMNYDIDIEKFNKYKIFKTYKGVENEMFNKRKMD